MSKTTEVHSQIMWYLLRTCGALITHDGWIYSMWLEQSLRTERNWVSLYFRYQQVEIKCVLYSFVITKRIVVCQVLRLNVLIFTDSQLHHLVTQPCCSYFEILYWPPALILSARRHGPEGARCDYEGVPVWIQQGADHYRFAGEFAVFFS